MGGRSANPYKVSPTMSDPLAVPPGSGDPPAVDRIMNGYGSVERSPAMAGDGTAFHAPVFTREGNGLMRSRDGGRAWSEPVAVSAPGVKHVRYHALTAREPGRVAVAYYGSPNGIRYHGYIAECADVFAPEPPFWPSPSTSPTTLSIATDSTWVTWRCGPAATSTRWCTCATTRTGTYGPPSARGCRPWSWTGAGSGGSMPIRSCRESSGGCARSREKEGTAGAGEVFTVFRQIPGTLAGRFLRGAGLRAWPGRAVTHRA